MRNKANFKKSQMVVTSVLTRNYNENPTLDTWSKQTQTKPILPAYMAGKIALSEACGERTRPECNRRSRTVEGPIQTTIRRRRIQHRNDPYGVTSVHDGLTESIRDTFFSRRQCFSCFSRAIAEFRSEKVSK
jgi:hypothetical protein